jgi:hypothetical protein
MRRVNRYVEALKENYNVVGLATAAAVSAAMLNPLPLLAGLLAEAAYLVFVPDSKWYDSRLSRRYDAEVEKRRRQLKEQVFPSLRPEMQECFLRLEETRRQISAQSMEGQKWFQEVLRKLDYLLEKFLMFASKEAQFRDYLHSVWEEEVLGPRRGQVPSGEQRRLPRGQPPPARQMPARAQPASGQGEDLGRAAADRWVQQIVRDIQAHYDREMDDLRRLMEEEQDANTKAVLEKRLEVLRRRHEFVGKIGRILTNLNHQLALLEDTFGLINDEIRARSPEQVVADIEDVVWQTGTMTQLLEEIAPYEQLASRMGT